VHEVRWVKFSMLAILMDEQYPEKIAAYRWVVFGGAEKHAL
jgi:hypothetical protein